MTGTQTDQAPSVSSVKSYITANAGTVSTVNSVSPVAGNVLLTTDNIAEGATNKYASSGTVRALISATAPIVYTQATGLISTTLTQYTDELAQDASASLLTTGTHTGISYSYVDGSNKIDSTVSLAGFSIDALSDVDTSTTPPTSGPSSDRVYQ